MVNYNLLTGKIKEDFNAWVKTNNEFIFDSVHKDMSLIEWLDSIGIYVGVFAGMYSEFNWNIQVEGTWKKWVSSNTVKTRKEAYEKVIEVVVEKYNLGHLIAIFPEPIQEATYVVGIDPAIMSATTTTTIYKKVEDAFELILEKKITSEEEFKNIVEKLKNYFNCETFLEKENKIDIKYLSIPNVCFSLTKKDDKREEKFSIQRIERGFDDSETWSLSGTLANFLLPRIKRFNELDNCERDKKYNKDMENFIALLELESRDEGARIFNKKEEKQIKKGLKAFKRIFFRLWW